MKIIILALSLITLSDLSLADTYLSQAQNLVKAKKYPEAISLLNNHIENLSFAEKIYLSDIYESSQNYPSAIQILNNLNASVPKNVAVLYRLGKNLSHSNEAQALKYFDQALEVNNKHLPTYQFLVSMYEKKRDADLQSGKANRNMYYELRNIYDKMLTAFGPKEDILVKLCENHYLDQLYESSLKYCKMTQEKTKKYPESFIYYGLSKINLEEKAEGEASLKRATELFPKSELSLYTYGNLKETQKDVITAYKYYKLALQANPKSVRSTVALANMSFSLKKYEESLGLYIKACELDKKTLPEIRKASNTLRLEINNKFQTAFDKAEEKCAY